MNELRRDCLNLWEVLAQSIAMLGPTLTPVLVVPLMYGSAGNASWLAYAFGSLLLLFVAINIRVFARRSASAGSLFEYARRAFGAHGALLCGWALLWAYVFVGLAGLTGFAVFGAALLASVHVTLPPLVPLLTCLALAVGFSYRDIRLSTITLLVFETGAVSLILVLFAVLLLRKATLVDPAQLSLHGATLSGIALGTTVAIFSLVGFESATSLGAEARNPLRTIPAAVILSVVVSGTFFVFCAYAEVLTARGLATTLDKLGTPLDALADAARLPAFKVAIDTGALLSSFSITLAALNAAARIVFAQARSGLFPSGLGALHVRFQTPHVALTAVAAILAATGSAMLLAGNTPLDAFNDTATLGSFGFVAIYVFVALGAPFYLRRLGELRWYHVVLSAFTLALLAIPAIGSVYPVPVAPANLFPYVFLTYFAVGVALLWSRSERLRPPVATGDAPEARVLA